MSHEDLREYLTGQFGKAGELYWAHFEELRKELGYADYLGALQRYRADLEKNGEAAHRLLSVSQFLIDYPFADRLYPDALEVLEKLGQSGRRSSCRTATSCSSRARCIGPASGRQWKDAC